MAGDRDHGEEERERRELLRTKQALSLEVEELLRQKAALSQELDVLLTERSTVELEGALEQLSDYHRRFFERVLEREIHRCARESAARFSTLSVETRRTPPAWFAEFLPKMVRLSDLSVKEGPRSFLVFLSGAGALGRRLFVSRLAKSLRAASIHHGQQPEVLLGGATWPSDGETASELVEAARSRQQPLRFEKELSLMELEPAAAAPSSRIHLLPPEGVTDTSPPEADPERVLDAIQAATASAEGGELVVRSGDVVGRVYIFDGRVAWAHCTSREVSLTEYLVEVGGADPQEIRFAYEHCRQTGDNFAETLIEFGAFERGQMRQVLAQHLRAHLDAVLHLPAPELLFLPQTRVYNSDLLFPLSSLLGPETAERHRSRGKIVSALRHKSATKKA